MYLKKFCIDSVMGFKVYHPVSFFFNVCRQYKEYLERMLDYLISFFQRTEPLQDPDRIFTKVLLVILSTCCFS